MTKEQRHEIYKGALGWHLKDKRTSTRLCVAQAGLCLFFEFYSEINLEQLPEFLGYMPESTNLSGHWWPCDPKDPNRERVLRGCIEKTKP